MISWNFYIINFLFFSVNSSIIPSQMCVCGHIQIQNTCVNSPTCQWTNEKCVIRPGSIYQQPLSNLTDCKFYGEEDCRINSHCGFHLGNCIDFEGCKVFKKDICQESSFQCVSDGQMCVQVKECTDYLSKIGCQNKNYKGNYCFWNNSEVVKCQDVKKCENLPLFLQSDEQCNESMEGCTVSDYGYSCTSKKDNCSEYNFEYQCHSTLNKQTCFWSFEKEECLEKICVNFSFSTDLECRLQLEECTTNGVICDIRKSCKEIQSAAGCIVDNQGIKCEYYDGQCQNKTCFTASKMLNTYNQCQEYEFNLDCVLSQNGGCKPRPTLCSEYFGMIDCYSVQSQNCIWINDKCELKQCYHAPIYYTHNNCKTFGNCIGKIEGGCETTPDDCSNISNEIFCEINFSGQYCIWINNKCNLLGCNRLSFPDYTNHMQCQSASPYCTFNFQTQTCADFNCENISEKQYCQTDSQGNECQLMQGCILKQCKTAPPTKKSNQDCEQWMAECTVQIYEFSSKKVLLGCTKKQSECQLFLKEQCYTTIYGYQCKWNTAINKCENDVCSNADTNQFITNEDCAKFKIVGQTCIIGNSGSGCRDWPTSCYDMEIEEQCNLNLQDETQCFWSGTICKQKQCIDAPKTLYLNNIECNKWMQNCIFNPTIGGCQIRPNDLECTQNPSNDMYDNHQKCQAWSPNCTVIDSLLSEGCIQKLSNCSQYQKQGSCKSTITGIICYWDDLKQQCQIWDFDNDTIPDCENRIYGNLSHEDCSSFLPQCTLANISRSCTTNYEYDCSYLKEQQCVITVQQQPCKWDQINKICKSVLCTDNTTAIKESECLKWRRYYECQLKINQNGSLGPGCENRPAECKFVTNPTICNLTFSQNQQSCFYITKYQLCQNLPDNNCELITFAKTNEECQYYNKNCILQQEGSSCVSFNQCSTLSQNTCGNTKMLFNQKCTYYSSDCRPNTFCSDLQIYFSTCDQKKDGFGNRCYYYVGIYYYSEKYCIQYTSDVSLNFSSNDIQKRTLECQQFSSYYHYANGYCIKNSNCAQLSVFGKEVCNSSNLSNKLLCGFNLQNNQCEDRKCEHLRLIDNPNLTNQDCFNWSYDCVLSTSNCIKFTGSDCNQNKLIYQCLQYSQCKWQTGNCVNYINCQENTTALTNYECLLISSQFCRLNYQSNQGCAFISCSVITNQVLCNQANTSDGQSCKWVTKCEAKLCSDYTNQISCLSRFQTYQISYFQVQVQCYWCNYLCISNNACDPNVQTPPIQHSDCYQLNPFNTILITFTNKCKVKESSCSNYDYEAACVVTINDIVCYWDQINKECQDYCKAKKIPPYDNADCFSFHNQCMSLSNTGCQLLNCSTLSNNLNCSKFPMKCFWNGMSCQTVGACINFNSSTQCTQNSQGQPCFWDGTVCNEKHCSNKPTSVNCHDWLSNCKLDTTTSSCVEDCTSADYSYKSHEQCETYYPSKSCTLKPGLFKCVQLPLNCSFAKQNQCFQDILGNQCYYSQTLNQCVDLSCSVLESTNHLECNQNLKTCTVNATLNGCQSLEQCNNYMIQEQCQIDLLFQKCEWIINQNICTLKSCATAQLSTYSAHSCQLYFGLKCTVNKTFDGCVNAAKNCIEYSLDQCQSIGQINQDGISCFWDETKKFCLDQNCQNGPSMSQTDDECFQYLESCQKGGCRAKSCFGFFYSVDSACASLFDDKRCVTNGYQCILRQQCEDVQIIDGCTYDKNLNICIWINDKCITKTCATAPIEFQTYLECSSYLQICTVKQGGGCIQKQTCKDNLIKESCFSDIDNQDCIWDDYLSQCYNNYCIGFCGDGILQSHEEQCDDANYIPYDGCYKCQIQCPYGCLICEGKQCKKCDEIGWKLENGICQAQCGDGFQTGNEECDDGNQIKYDGCYQCQYQCDQQCQICFQGTCVQCSKGYYENGAFCNTRCGDGYLVPSIEKCDDGNLLDYDGCSNQCEIENNWICQTYNDISLCIYSISPTLQLTPRTLSNSAIQEVELSFSEEVRLNTPNINEEQFLQMIFVVIQNSNEQNYYIEMKAIRPISTQLSVVSYVIQINFLNQISDPILKVSIKSDNIVNLNDMPLLVNEKTLSIKTPNIFSKSKTNLALNTALFNKWMLYSIIAISIISFFCGNLEILWNLLDLLQQLSYIKYHNIKFPTNLVIYFEVFTIGSLTPITNYFNLDTLIQKTFEFEKPLIFAKYKFQDYQVTCYFFEILQTCAIIFITGVLNYFLFKIASKILSKLKFEDWPILLANYMPFMKWIITILFNVQKLLNSYCKYFFYSGIMRIYISNYYDLTFSAALQMSNFNTETKINTIISITAFGALIFNLYLTFFIFSQLNQRKKIHQLKILVEGIKCNNNNGSKQYLTIILIKKTIFILNLVLFQDCPEAQSLVTAVLSGVYSVYMIRFKPFQNKFENDKIILTELLIMFNSMLFPIQQIFSMRSNIEIVEYLGWLNIGGFSMILAGTLLIDLYQQSQKYFGRIKNKILQLLGYQQPARSDHMIMKIYYQKN